MNNFVELSKGIFAVDVGLFLEESSTLIIGDIHLGQEENLQKQGILIPQNQYLQVLKTTIKIIEATNPKIVIINGDLKHNFGNITGGEWDEISKYLKTIKKYAKMIIIKGNHDLILKPILDKLKIDLVRFYLVGNIYVCHGDKLPDNKEFSHSKTIIIGHEHPAIKLRDGARLETYKCFLVGKYNKKNLIVMPSLNPLKEGSDILNEKTLSPFIDEKKLKNFEVYIIGEKIYDFGKLRNLDQL